jgi:hypothetical protein
MERIGSQRERIEGILLEEMKVAFRRHEEGLCTADEYLAALKRFAEFVVGGRVPKHLIDLQNSNGKGS